MNLSERFSEKEYHVPFFDEEGYKRKRCSKCGGHFWTLIPTMDLCGEASSEGCASYTFINNPPTKRAYSLDEMREAFLGFFEKRGHRRMKPYPVVARWRDDLYLTNASIVDFQPYVTNGIIPPPSNPLVISQPCIRLVDVDKTGPTFGRHLTVFEMGGHHAFNYPDLEVYWKDQTVRYHHDFATKELGIPSEEVIYKEDIWIGGGNAGPDLETIVRGLEIATLVFMKFKVVNNEFVELPIRTVDTGYGIERFTWLSQGTVSAFHAVYGNIPEVIFEMAKMEPPDIEWLAKIAKFSSGFAAENHSLLEANRNFVAKIAGIDAKTLTNTLEPIVNIYAVADHTKSLIFMLAEGVVPSNVQEGYLTRLLIRRTYRLLEALGIENQLDEIINLQINFWSNNFPHLKTMQAEILNMLSIEKRKFEETLRRGKKLVKRIAEDLKSQGQKQIPTDTLLQLYDSHGLPPEAVRNAADEEQILVKIPEGFYKMVAKRHLQASPQQEPKMDHRQNLVADLPETRMLYYEDAYTAEFESKILQVLDDNQVVLEQTIFFPEGGGQPADHGVLEFDGKEMKVINVEKIGKVIIHSLQGSVPKKAEKVKGRIDWNRRFYLMRAHTATHLVMGAARRVLGQHVWQAGTQKNVERTRLDISHHRRLTYEEVHKIESLANQAVFDMIPVEIRVLPRDEAEAQHGFRLYQGGAVPGREIRVVKVGDWEVEACAGTHVKNTGEVGFIKILNTERIQDGVERIAYATGRYAVEATQRNELLLRKLSEILSAPLEKLAPTAKRFLKECKDVRREKERLQKALVKKGTGTLKPIKMGELVLFSGTIGWASDEEGLVATSNEYIKATPNGIAVIGGIIGENSRIIVSVGSRAIEKGIKADEIASMAGSLLGGGGSGTATFAQAGGPQKDSLEEAYGEARKLIEKVLKKHNK